MDSQPSTSGQGSGDNDASSRCGGLRHWTEIEALYLRASMFLETFQINKTIFLHKYAFLQLAPGFGLFKRSPEQLYPRSHRVFLKIVLSLGLEL